MVKELEDMKKGMKIDTIAFTINVFGFVNNIHKYEAYLSDIGECE